MFVADVGRSWLRHPWKTKSKLITSPEEITELLDHGIHEVVIDLSRSSKPKFQADGEFGLSVKEVNKALQVSSQEVLKEVTRSHAQAQKPSKPKRPEGPQDNVSLNEELPKARQAYLQALNVTREFMNEVRAGKKIEVEKVQESLEDMIDSVFRNRGAISALLKLKNYDEYTFTHSLNVATLAISIGRQVALSRAQLMDLGLGAIFHDVGKVRIPEDILNKPSRLTNEEFAIMKTHASLGAMVLKEQHPNLPSIIYRMVRHHHERHDGSGYPSGLTDNQIDSFVTVCGICDVYDALSSDRVYHKGMLPHEALKVVFSLRDKHFPQSWADRFVQCIGIYPPATTVRLTTGETGVIMVVNPDNLLKPQVMIVKDPKNRFLVRTKLVDLGLPEYSDRGIVSVVDPKPLGIDAQLYFGG